MKNYILSLLIIFGCTLQAKEINGLEFITENYKTSVLDLSLKQNAWVGLSAIGGAAGTYLGKKALENTLNTPNPGEYNSVRFCYPSEWSLIEKIITSCGSLFFGSLMLDYYKPEEVAKLANKDDLLNVILKSKTNEEIQTALDEKFVTHQFPRSQAFAQLASLRTKLIHLIDLITEHNINRPKPYFKKIKSALNANLKKVDTALLIIKKDSRWFEECNAHTINRVQRTQQTQQNAELAGAAINIAHAYAR